MHRLRFVLALCALTAACKKSREAEPAPPAPGPKGSKAVLGGGTAKEFTPSTQGFKFQNYGNEDGIENLTPVEVERLFGAQVCADPADKPGEPCTLTPPAQRWMEETNKGMDGGHCEGLATLALLFQLGKEKPADYGAASAFALALADNKKLQHEVAYWFSTQFLAPMSTAEIRTLSPTEVADKLADAFTTGKDSYTIGIYQPDGSGGHATTPYAVVDKGGGKTWILHYDNNFPGEERHIEIDRAKNTWSYFTAADPKEPGSAYTGDATTHTLTLSPTSVRVGKLECPFCGDIDSAEPVDESTSRGMRQIILDGGADLLVTDEHGKRVGHAGGKLVSEIPGAQILEPRAGEARRNTREPIYQVPRGSKLTLTLDGSVLAGKEDTGVSLIGPGYTLDVSDIALSPGEQDTIGVAKDWSELTYTTQHDESPVLEIGIETSGADYVLEVQAASEAAGIELHLALDAAAGTLAVAANAKDGSATYTVEVRRIDDHGTQTFKHAGVQSAAGDRLVLHYKDWAGNGTAMTGELDKGGDGHVDDREDLGDED